jgi:short-subunit dehydrogenase
MELRNSVGILTGASRGIGAELADALARKGVNLALAARSKDDLEQVADRARMRGVKVIAVPTDISNRGELQDLVDRTREELGPIDLLVNNAGLEIAGYSHELDPDHIDQVVQVNLTSLMQLSRMVLPEMMQRRHGHICNIASVAGKVARPYAVVYAATKHGVVGFSWSLRAEMAEHDVEVSVVCPGYVGDVGMFATRTAGLGVGKPPAALKAVSVDDVVSQTLKSIETNRAEYIVGPLMMKVADVFHALSPDFAMGVARKSGSYRFVKKEATGD